MVVCVPTLILLAFVIKTHPIRGHIHILFAKLSFKVACYGSHFMVWLIYYATNQVIVLAAYRL